MSANPAQLYLQDIPIQFQKLKDLAERALAQVRDEDLFVKLDPESNSLVMIVQHLAGSLRSRWTDFLTTDGEKPDRNRDAEFEVRDEVSRAELMARWEDGWACVFDTLAGLREEDLVKTILIRSESHSVVQAIHRGMTHVSYHVGQIVFLAKHFSSASWQTLTIPRGKSGEFTEAMRRKASANPGS